MPQRRLLRQTSPLLRVLIDPSRDKAKKFSKRDIGTTALTFQRAGQEMSKDRTPQLRRGAGDLIGPGGGNHVQRGVGVGAD